MQNSIALHPGVNRNPFDSARFSKLLKLGKRKTISERWRQAIREKKLEIQKELKFYSE